MKQNTGSVSSSLYEDGHNSRNNILNVYKDNIQTHTTRIHYYNTRRHIYEECECAVLWYVMLFMSFYVVTF
jgi:hypothetical protein